MINSTIFRILIFILTLVPGLLFAENVIDDSKNPGYLYVMGATSGSIKGDTLTLNGVPNVVYFSDRPARIAGHMSLSKFVEGWNKGSDSFKADPPNATLSVLREGGNKQVKLLVIELMSVEMKKGSPQFTVDILEGSVSTTFGPSTLFIDMALQPHWEGGGTS